MAIHHSRKGVTFIVQLLLCCVFVWISKSEIRLLIQQQQQQQQQINAVEKDRNNASGQSNVKFNSNNRYGVVGILSNSLQENRYKRMAQRVTWVKDAPFYNVKVYFLIDQPDPSLDTEQELFGDIVYINATYSGRAVRFGEKLYRWFKVAHGLHPDAAFVAKVDDDCVVCSNIMWPFVWRHLTQTSYMGWMHRFQKFSNDAAAGLPVKIGKDYRMDEFFVVLGMALVGRIADRSYCHDEKNCNKAIQLFDTNYGGTSLGIWLGAYNDLKVTTFNEISQHPTIQFPMRTIDTNPLSYTCPNYPYVHSVKDPLAHLPVYNQST